MRTSPLIAACCGIFLVAGCPSADIPEAEQEVPTKHGIQLDLPAVPEFSVPPMEGDMHPVTEMRLKGDKYLDQDVKIKGFVVWIYDCRQAIRKPNESDKDLDKRLEDSPDLCARPNFYLGETADAPTDRSVRVVDVPRPPRKDELKTLPKDMLKNWPKVPEYAVGQEVVVSGKWALRSPQGFASSDGLLVYGDLQHVGEPAPAPAP